MVHQKVAVSNKILSRLLVRTRHSLYAKVSKKADTHESVTDFLETVLYTSSMLLGNKQLKHIEQIHARIKLEII